MLVSAVGGAALAAAASTAPAAASHAAFRTPRNWPALIVGIVVATYWVRVMIMVRQSKRKAGHGANLVPPEPLGRVLRIIWMPVTLLWIVLPFVAFAARTRGQLPPEVRPVLDTHLVHVLVPLQWLAAAAAVACLWATFVCWQRMGKSWRMGIDPNDRTQLVCNGPYAYVRHPIYGLSSLLMLATMVAVPNLLMWVCGVIHLTLLQWEARREEAHLTRVHGEEYRRYARGTGRFFPRTTRRYDGGGSNG